MTISNMTETQHKSLPQGFTMRPVHMDDLNAVTDMINDSAKLEKQHEQYTYDDMRSEWEQPNFNLAEQARVIIAPNGDIAAYLDVHTELPTRMYLWHRVHATYTGTTVSLHLLQWAEDTMRAHIHEAPQGARVVYHAGSRPNDDACEQRFAAIGMEKVRNFYHMRIDMTEAPSVPPLPEGIMVRDYRHPDDLRATLRAELDAFKDHWGYVEPDFDKEVQEARHFIDSDPLFDPSLSLLAIDSTTGEIAGVVSSRIEANNDPTVGYVNTLSVQRTHRGRGLGTYLLKLSFKRLYEKGKHSVTLGVDADSLTGATRLYEKAGMFVSEVHARWEKELRPGSETMTTTVDK